MVDPHDSLSHPVGVSDVQTESASCIDPDQFTNFLVPNWFEGECSGSTKNNPFPLPEAYVKSQQKNIAEASVIQGFKQLRMTHTVKFTDNISEADALLALQTKLARLQAAAKSCATPVYVAKASSMTQLTKAIIALMTDYEDGFDNFAPEVKVLEKIDALKPFCWTPVRYLSSV